MRPRHLLIEAVGPYAGRVELDIDAISGDGIFLIQGRTGSGKTFLLDAMTFALYGEVPGARQSQPLRSDHAAPDAEPVVRLDFTVDGIDWRVERSPAHRRAKKRGEGTTEKAQTAALHRRQGHDWVVVESGARQVTNEVQRIIGLTREQFTQVVLLPQGQVERVLRAGSDERERLLETLFGTSVFDRVADLLDVQARDRNEALDAARADLAQLEARAIEVWTETFAASGVDVSGGEIDDLVTIAATEVARLQRRAADADADLVLAEARRAAIRGLAVRWDERATLRARLAELDGQQATIDQLLARLEAAERAAGLAAELHATAEARSALDEATGELAEAVGSLQDVLDELGRHAPDALRAVLDDGHAGDAVTAIADIATAVRADLALVEQHRVTTRRLDDHRRRRTQAAATEVAAADLLHALTGELEQLDDDLLASKAAAEQVPQAAEAADRAQRRAEAAGRLVQVGLQLPVRLDAVDASERRLAAALDAENTVLRTYVDGLAAELATSLVDGAPCAVCGATDHPAPARLDADHVDRVTLDASRSRTEATRGELTAAVDALALLRQELAVLETEVGAPAGTLDPDAIEHDALRFGEALTRATRLAGQLPELQQRRTTLEARRGDADRASEEARLALGQIDVEVATAIEQVEALDRDLQGIDPDELRRMGVALPTAFEAVERLSERRAVRAEAATRFADAGAALDEGLRTTGFADEAEAAAALFSPGDTASLRHQVQEHDREVHAVRRALDAPALSDLDESQPDSHAAELAHEEATSTVRDRHRALTTAQNAATTLAKLAAEAGESRSLLDPLLAEATDVQALADACRGQNAGRISLQRWVLGTYLDHICTLANHRLTDMTGGRYALVAHRDRERGNARSGLGLRVLDAHTGVSRDVASLSGGETFQASLALALGIADAVTAATGGIRLDALFVDEGFGSLDPDALDQAMAELGRLRDGNRLVGVISHVGSLTEQIPVGVEVLATERGSTLRSDLLGCRTR